MIIEPNVGAIELRVVISGRSPIVAGIRSKAETHESLVREEAQRLTSLQVSPNIPNLILARTNSMGLGTFWLFLMCNKKAANKILGIRYVAFCIIRNYARII